MPQGIKIETTNITPKEFPITPLELSGVYDSLFNIAPEEAIRMVSKDSADPNLAGIRNMKLTKDNKFLYLSSSDNGVQIIDLIGLE